MEVTPGYKQTRAGVIPTDWDVLPFDAIFQKAPAKNYQIQTKEYHESGAHPVVDQGQALIVGYSDREDKLFHVPDGGVVIFGDHTCIVKFVRFDFIVGADGTQIVSAKGGQDAEFHAYALMHRSVAATGYNRHFKLLKERDFQAPAHPEQRAIAAALSDVDALLGGLDRLIAKKCDLKQAAMQQLLTGQTRLPGFIGEWEVKQLRKLCTMKSGEGITARSIDEVSPFPCYGGNGLRGFTSRFTHEGDYCLIGRVGALCGNLLKVTGKFFASEHAIVATAFDDVDVSWLTLALGTLNLNRRSESSAQPVLTVSKLLPLEVHAPSTMEEQTAIAGVLSDMDAELAALKARRDKTRDLKQAMMQDLLTGKTRLVKPEAALA